MRLTRLHLFLLAGLVMAIATTVAFTQFPGGGKKGNKGMGMGGDFQKMIFEKMSGGKDTLTVSEYKVDPQWARFSPPEEKIKEWMNSYLQEKGITNGKMTFDQFKGYSEWARPKMTEHFSQMRGQWGKGDKKGGSAKGGPPAPGGPAAPGGAQDQDGQARDMFKRLDTNNDGSLSVEEMQAARRMGSRIYDERDKYDRNKNKTIEVDEYIEYYKSRNNRNSGGNNGGGNWGGQQQQQPPKPEEKKVVYRTGNLPKELPDWFEKLDAAGDKDGQVGLYEWKKSDRKLEEFLAMDVNADGLLTVEEVLRFQKADKTAKDKKNGVIPGKPGQTPATGVTGNSRFGGGGMGRGRGPGGGGGNGFMPGGNGGRGNDPRQGGGGRGRGRGRGRGPGG